MLLSHIHVLWAPFIVLSKALKVLSKDGWKALKTLRLPWRLSGKEFACSEGATGDMGLIPALGGIQ